MKMCETFDRDSEVMATGAYQRMQQGGLQPLVCAACGSAIQPGSSSCQCGGEAAYGVEVRLILPVLEAAALASLAKRINTGGAGHGHAERINIAAQKLSDALLHAGVYVSG